MIPFSFRGSFTQALSVAILDYALGSIRALSDTEFSLIAVVTLIDALIAEGLQQSHTYKRWSLVFPLARNFQWHRTSESQATVVDVVYVHCKKGGNAKPV